MNRNPKEKLARIEIRVKPKDKEKIKKLAEKCNLSVSEYVVQRSLGYAPRTVQPETENKLLMLIDEIHSEFLLPRKEDIREWRQQDSGQSKTS